MTLQPFYVCDHVGLSEHNQHCHEQIKVFKASDLVKMLKERIEDVDKRIVNAFRWTNTERKQFKVVKEELESLLREVEGENELA